MGPRFCKRGNKLPDGSYDLVVGLQWGHAFVSVETLRPIRRAQSQADASMGPRFCKRGNSLCPSALLLVIWLQWDHAFVSVETSTSCAYALATSRFNGATLL